MKLGVATTNLAWIRETIAQCKRDLDLAQTALEQQNVKGAVVNSYDAARNAIECHMNAHGLRVSDPVGSHKTVIDYAADQLGDVIDANDIVLLDQLRELRHGAEYPMSRASRVPLTEDDARQAIALCDRIARSIGARLLAAGPPTQP